MTSVDSAYCVMLDKDIGFCRLFRTDNELLPEGEVLWSGDNLRLGYDAMIRLNKDRRPINSYSVCSTASKTGRIVYRIVKGTPDAKHLKVEDVFYDYAAARTCLSELTALRDAAEKKEKDRMRMVMKRVGITSNRIPKFTTTDQKYIDWLYESGKISDDDIHP